MADKELHILVTGESGQGRSFVIRKKTLQSIFFTGLAAMVIFSIGTAVSFNLFSANRSLKQQVAGLSCTIKSATEGLNSQLASTQAELASSLSEKETLLQQYKLKIDQLQQEKAQLMEKSISRLDERSKIIESIVGSIGVDVKIEEDPKHSGGPYITPDDADYGKRLLAHTDKYLEILAETPLGKPVPNRITSRYGTRKDPLNKKKAFHQGVDFKGRKGDKIRATAWGKVKKSTYSKSFGHFIVIRHKDGYETLFAHMNKRLVKRGETVKRGQVIGHIGNTGRSTGSHLHYEIHRNGRPINPMKFIKVADLRLKINQ